MSITEVKQALGSWTLQLKPETPKSILDSLTYFGHIAVLPGQLNPVQHNDNLLTTARYVGVYRNRSASDKYVLKGSGMAFWLGDEDDKGDILESPVAVSGETFANTIRALLPTGGSITEGTLFSVAGTYTGNHQWVTPRSAITYVTDLFGAEWRVNHNGTLDAGPISSLYVTTPKALVLRRSAGVDLQRRAIPGDMSMDVDVEEMTTRVVLLAEGEGSNISTGSADAPATTYKDIHGNLIKMTRLISESNTDSGNAAARAQLQLNRFVNARRAVDLSSDTYDIKGDFVVGDYLDVYDPESGFIDTNREIYWQGQPINPMALRCVEMSWPIPPGWTVAFRDINGNWIDLTPYYIGEEGDTTITVGELTRGLSTASGEPVGVRPNLPDSPENDTSIPDAPDFTSFSVGSYQSATEAWAKSAIRAEWTTPLNTDGSTVLDGSHYEIRYRVDHSIGYQTTWDTLSGYNLVFDDQFKRTTTNGWGPPWTSSGTSVANFLTDGDNAIHRAPTSGHNFLSDYTGSSLVDADVLIGPITISATPVGANMEVGAFARFVDSNNFLDFRLFYTTSGTVTMAVRQMIAGVETFVGFPTVPDATATTPLWVRMQAMGTSLRAMAWLDGETPPTSWTAEMTVTHTSAGTFRVRGNVPVAISNAMPFDITYGSFRVFDLSTTGGFTWDGLGTWDALVSEPVAADPQWQSMFVPWGTNAATITELTPGVTYELQIRGVDAADPPNRGPFSVSSFVTTTGDIFAPSAPAAPIVAASMIAIQVQHNLGKATGGDFNLEPDLHHLDVHVGGDTSFYPESSNKVGELIATGAMVTAGIPAVGTFKVDNTSDVWVKVVAVDISGNKSSGSDAAQVTIVLIDDAHISNLSVSKLTAGTITANSVLAAEMEVGAGGNIKLTDGSLDVFNNLGQKMVEAGQLSNGDFGLAAVDTATGDLVDLATLAFGIRADTVTTAGTLTGAGIMRDIPGSYGPEVFVTIGDAGRCIVTVSTEIESTLRENFALETGNGEAGFIMTEVATGIERVSAATSRAAKAELSYDKGAHLDYVPAFTFRMGATRVTLIENLPSGLYQVTMKYFNVTNDAIFRYRTLIVQPF